MGRVQWQDLVRKPWAGGRSPQGDQWDKHGQGDKIWAAQANSLFVLPIFVVLGLPCQTCPLVHKSLENGGPGSFSARRCLEQDIRVGIRSQPDHINHQDFRAWSDGFWRDLCAVCRCGTHPESDPLLSSGPVAFPWCKINWLILTKSRNNMILMFLGLGTFTNF